MLLLTNQEAENTVVEFGSSTLSPLIGRQIEAGPLTFKGKQINLLFSEIAETRFLKITKM